jgi:hypothetical protein
MAAIRLAYGPRVVLAHSIQHIAYDRTTAFPNILAVPSGKGTYLWNSGHHPEAACALLWHQVDVCPLRHLAHGFTEPGVVCKPARPCTSVQAHVQGHSLSPAHRQCVADSMLTWLFCSRSRSAGPPCECHAVLAKARLVRQTKQCYETTARAAKTGSHKNMIENMETPCG